MSKTVMAGVAALAIFWTGTAHAEDFTGPRLEARVGWDHARPGDQIPAAEGVSFGVAAGYDFALSGNIIAGVEAGVDLFDNKTKRTSTTTSSESSAKRDLEIAGRIGATLTDRVLIYGKAGYSNARFEEILTVGGTTGTTRTEFATNLHGIRAGAGIEARVRDGLFAKTEYRYTNYEQGVSRHQVIAAVGYRF